MLDEADFSTAMRGLARPEDIVWISLSLHHLDTDAKLAFMREVRQGLEPDGAFLVYEPTRRDGEDRPAYLDRFEDIGRREWTELTPTEFAEALKHVRTCDLPETVSEWERLGREAGLRLLARALQVADRSLPALPLPALSCLAFFTSSRHIPVAGAIRGGPRPHVLD